METPSVLTSVPNHFAPLYCLSALYILFKVCIWIRITGLQKGSLSSVPGPRLARWSRLWLVRALASGRSHEAWIEVNSRYGPLVRIGPKHVVTDDPVITRRVLAARSGYKRGPSFDSLRMDPVIPNIISERDSRKHALIRAKVAPSFTGRSMAAIEPIMDEQILDWVDSLRTSPAKSASSVSIVNIGQKIQFLTVDIITRLCLGDAVGCVKNNRDMHSLLETVELGNRVCQYLSVITEGNTLLLRLGRVPALRRMLFPKVGDAVGVGRLMGLVHEVIEKRASKESRADDLVSALLDKGMPTEQIDSEVIVALAGGSDTTSTSVQSTLLCIATSPHVYAKLRAEIRAAVQRGVSTPIRDAEAKELVYLQACVIEGLRKHPPLSQLRERVVPAGGDTLGGFHLPAGTLVGFNGWGTQLRPEIYGDDAELFRPERWLTDDCDRLKEMHATHSLIFGHGATKCLGMAMALMEIPKVLFELLRNFDVTIADPHSPWRSRCYGIFHQEGFQVCLRPVDDAAKQPPAYE